MISVIVPTRNRAEQLQLALSSLGHQTLPSLNFEIIVVDNGSRDQTATIVSEFGKTFGHLRYVYDASPGLHVGRHRGLREAVGDILVFVDDDIEAFPTLLASIRSAFENPKVVLVGGKCLPKYEGQMPEWLSEMWAPNAHGERMLSYLSLIDLGDQSKFVDPLFVFGCNFSIRRSILIEAGGFHPDGLPQELIRFRGDGESYVSRYIAAKGYKAFYHPQATVYHYVPKGRMTIEYLCRRAYNEGISSSYTKIRNAHGLESPARCPVAPFSSPSPERLWAKVRRKGTKGIIAALRNRARRSFQILRQPRAVKLGIATAQNLSSIAAAYQAGYVFHQNAVQESNALLAWVLRPDYWDAQLPNKGN